MDTRRECFVGPNPFGSHLPAGSGAGTSREELVPAAPPATCCRGHGRSMDHCVAGSFLCWSTAYADPVTTLDELRR